MWLFMMLCLGLLISPSTSFFSISGVAVQHTSWHRYTSISHHVHRRSTHLLRATTSSSIPSSASSSESSNEEVVSTTVADSVEMTSGSGGNANANKKPPVFISPSILGSNGVSTSYLNYEQDIIIENLNQIIQSKDRKKFGILGTRELTDNQSQMIELLSYALVLSGNHVITSGGGSGTNIAVIRGALRACNPDLLTVMLPQSIYKQPAEIQALLQRVQNIHEMPEYDHLDLREAANLCNVGILSSVDKILVFVYHDSDTILKPLEEFQQDTTKELEIIKFYLD